MYNSLNMEELESIGRRASKFFNSFFYSPETNAQAWSEFKRVLNTFGLASIIKEIEGGKTFVDKYLKY